MPSRSTRFLASPEGHFETLRGAVLQNPACSARRAYRSRITFLCVARSYTNPAPPPAKAPIAAPFPPPASPPIKAPAPAPPPIITALRLPLPLAARFTDSV